MLKKTFQLACGIIGINLIACFSLFAECDESHLPPSPDQLDREWDWMSVQHAQICNGCDGYGVWLPEGPPLFRPFVADPREVSYSVGWRFDDQALEKNVIDVSFGDSLPIYQWWNVWPWGGQMRVELEGSLWAVFSPCQDSSPLVNADYYCAIPITYLCDLWSFRLRIYHISSHMGDEFLINHWHKRWHGEECERFNPSAEYVDFFASYDITDDIRLYAGLGYVLHMDESFKIGRFYAEAGAELHLRELGYVDYCNNIYGMPFYGMHFRHRSDFKNHLDQTYVLGYEWGKMEGLCRLLRFYAEYHDGYSPEGQFSRLVSSYFSLRASYGF